MNKAFVREPDSTAEYCPRCGTLGQPVVGETLDAPRPRVKTTCDFADSACFCPAPHAMSRTSTIRSGCAGPRISIMPSIHKDSRPQICACFGLTRDDIEKDVDRERLSEPKALLEKAQVARRPMCAQGANGQSCVAYVQKYYLQCRNRRES